MLGIIFAQETFTVMKSSHCVILKDLSSSILFGDDYLTESME